MIAFLIIDAGDIITRRRIDLPDDTKLTRLYRLSDNDGWTGGWMCKSDDGGEVAVEDES